jgi:hypothetical protein
MARGRVRPRPSLAIHESSTAKSSGCIRTPISVPLPVGDGPLRFFVIKVRRFIETVLSQRRAEGGSCSFPLGSSPNHRWMRSMAKADSSDTTIAPAETSRRDFPQLVRVRSGKPKSPAERKNGGANSQSLGCCVYLTTPSNLANGREHSVAMSRQSRGGTRESAHNGCADSPGRSNCRQARTRRTLSAVLPPDLPAANGGLFFALQQPRRHPPT